MSDTKHWEDEGAEFEDYEEDAFEDEFENFDDDEDVFCGSKSDFDDEMEDEENEETEMEETEIEEDCEDEKMDVDDVFFQDTEKEYENFKHNFIVSCFFKGGCKTHATFEICNFKFVF